MTSSRERSRFRAFAAIVALVLSTTTLSANAVTAADKETARALVKEGRALRAQKDFAAALEKFKAADALWTIAPIGEELVHGYIDVGDLLMARETAIRVSQTPKDPADTATSDKARAECLTLAKDLEARIPSLLITVSGTASGVTPIVKVDGIDIPFAALSQPRKLNPGTHTVVVTGAAEQRYEKSIELKEGENKEITASLPEVKPPAVVDPPPAVVPPPASTAPPVSVGDRPSSKSSVSTLTYVGFGIGGAGLLVGSVTGLLAMSKASSVKSNCPDAKCPPSAHSDLDSTHTFATISTIGFVAAGVGAVIGIIGLTTGGDAKEASARGPNMSLWVGAGSAGVVGAF
jgi:hypothetical protein